MKILESDDPRLPHPFFKRHYKRRKKNHDYKDPWKYHITLAKDPSAPLFCTLRILELIPNGVSVDLLPLGLIIEEEIRNFSLHHPQIKVVEHIVMPDHVHLLIQVKERLSRAVGNAIGGLMTGISKIWRELNSNPEIDVFEKGFNDRIMYSFISLDAVCDYIRQNPYRLAVRRARPDFFQKQRNIFIWGREVQAYGNLFHLRNPFKFPLIVHRADDERIFSQKLEECLYYAANGGVVVSAFISQREKEIRREIEEMGGRIILISNCPIANREKPAKHDFGLCCEGRLLIISPIDYLALPKSEHPSRSQCMDMNQLAERLSGKSGR